MKLIILDVVSPDFVHLKKVSLKENDTTILALTPSSFYFLEENSIEFLSFHDLISQKEFQQEILKLYKELQESNQDMMYFDGFFLDIAKYVNYFYFINTIIHFVKTRRFKFIYYISDRQASDKKILNNSSSLLYKYLNFDEITTLFKINRKYKKRNNYLKKYNLNILLRKIKNKFLKNNLCYDWLYINPSIKKREIKLEKFALSFKLNKFRYIEQNKVDFDLQKGTSFLSSYMTFLISEEYIQTLKYKKQNNKLFFFQHGSYLYKNIFIKNSELKLADINFVFNDYTKKLFEDLDAKKVYSVGSILFNKPIKEKKKEYDFLYITQGHDYTGNLQYVDFQNSLHSFDGYELYQRHKSIIKLFGTKFKEKKILIRVHPTVVTTGVYVPFWELAEEYPNITIDVSISIFNLIEKSKYIISDYFTTEFINRELHYKRDIILFQGVPTPLPKETIEDMKKMFILVDTLDDLKEKIENIEKITKNRKRYDDIIEYYSSKKCDTKKVVTEILERELNARR